MIQVAVKPLPRCLVTERLILRQWAEGDLEPFAQMNQDPMVMEHFPKMHSRDESKAIMSRISGHFDDFGFGLWATELRETEEFIGFIGLQNVFFESHFSPCVEVGWRLSQKHWGRGYAPEGASAALTDAFDRLPLQEVVSMTAATNLNSMRVMQKLGMTRDPNDDFEHPNIEPGSKVRPHVLYRISRDAWLNR